MAETLISLLSRLDGEQVSESEAKINEMFESNPVDFMSAMLEILKSDVPVNILSSACVITGSKFPAIEKLPNDPSKNPINIFGDNLSIAIIEQSFENIERMDDNHKHHPAVLLGKIAVHIVHRDFENNQIVNRLCESLQTAETVPAVQAYSTALGIILEGYEPNEEQVQNLVTAIFNHFTSTDNINVSVASLDIMFQMIENITELLEDPSFTEAVASILLALLENEQSIVHSLRCILRLAKIVPAMVADISEPIVLTACNALNESQVENVLIAACLVIKKIAKLELKDQTHELETIKNYGEVIFMCLAQTLCRNSDFECATADQWSPFIASYQTLKAVLPNIIQNQREKVVELMDQFLQSENTNEIEAGLRILSLTIPLILDENGKNDPEFGSQYLSALTQFLESEYPCIRQRSLRCIRKVIEVMSQSDLFKTDQQFKESTISTANEAVAFLELLNDVPQIASEVTSLMLVLTKIEGFAETEQVIGTILQKAAEMKESFSKDPFIAFNEIIAEGPAEPAAAAFPDVVTLYRQAVSTPELSWLAQELVETIQVYCYRTEFQQGVSAELDTLVPMFMEVIGDGGEDALIPLAALAKASHSQFMPYLQSTIDIYNQVFTELVNQPTAFYGALVGTDILINEGFEMPDYAALASLCAQQLTNFDHEANVRTAIMRLLATLASKTIQVVIPVLDELLPFLKVYAKTLPVQVAIGREDSDLMAYYLSTILTNIYKNVEPEAAANNFEIAADILRYYSNFPPILKTHLISMLNLAHSVAAIDPDFILSQINIEEGIGQLFVDAKDVPEANQLALQLLSVLHYQA